MRTQFEEELVALSSDITRLGNAANEAFHKAMKAFYERDKDLAEQLVADDLHINNLTIEIEQTAYKIIVLQQPVADDLRQVFAALISSNDFERLADHAVSIAKAVIRQTDNSSDVEELDEIVRRMADPVGDMLSNVIEALAAVDVNRANQIAAKDAEVDALLKKMYRESSKRMEYNTEVVPLGISYIGIANNLERIGDYVSNICEQIIYMKTGAIVELN